MTFFAIGGTASFTTSTVQLKNKFSVAVKALPGLDTDLFVEYDSGFDTLVGILICVNEWPTYLTALPTCIRTVRRMRPGRSINTGMHLADMVGARA